MKIKLLLTIIVAALFLTVPDFSHAQKRKVKKKPNQTKKTTTKVSSVEVNPIEAEWQKVTSEEGKFSILFPTKPQYFKQDVPINLTQYMWFSSEDSENVGYSIMAQTPGPADNLSENGLLQFMQQQIRAASWLELTNISTSGTTGLRWKTDSSYDFEKGWIQYGKIIRDKRTRRVYTILFAVNGLDREKKFLKSADKFFNSFKIL